MRVRPIDTPRRRSPSLALAMPTLGAPALLPTASAATSIGDA